MIDDEKLMWGIHAGRVGEANTLFLSENVVALGWGAIGDLNELEASRDAFKACYEEMYPNSKPGAVPVDAGQLFRFVHEMQVGDIVVYPSKHDRRVYVGEVSGDYVYSPELNASYPHHRPVRWINSFPRTRFTQGALYEIGAAITLFQVKNYADEFLDALEGGASFRPVAEDETFVEVAESFEEGVRDFVLKQLAQELKGHPLAHFVAHLLETMGYRTRVSPPGPDEGVDVLAQRDELGLSPTIKVQVKSSDETVGLPVVKSLYGSTETNEFGLFVTLGAFSSQARDFADSRSNLRLIDGAELVDLVLEHYDKLDTFYRRRIPLKHLYVPEVSSPEDE